MPECIFCKIARGQIPATKVIDEDEIVAFRDLSPQAPQHILVIPRQHIGKLSEAQKEDRDLLGNLLLAAKGAAAAAGYPDDFRVVVNNGASAGQSVFHIHLHVLAGRDFAWPPG